MKNLMIPGLLLALLYTVSCKQQPKPDDTNVIGQPDTTTSTVTGGADGEYIIDTSSSVLKWRGFKPTGEEYGTVPIYSGKVTVTNGNITWGIIELDMRKITALGIEGESKRKLEGHLRGTTPGQEEDFFNTNQYPKSIFVVNSSTRLENDPDGTHMINGTLTIKDINKPVSFKAKVNIANGKLTATTPEFPINRAQYEIKFKSKSFFNNLRDDFINDEFKVQISINANKI